MNVLIIYHGDADGKLSATLVADWYPQAEINFIEAQYGDEFPVDEAKYHDVVWVLDFSYENMQEVKEVAPELHWIDHHESAKRKYPVLWKSDEIPGERRTDQSACRLTWEYLYNEGIECHHVAEGNKIYTLRCAAKYVNDYDLWIFEFDDDTKSFIERISNFELRDFLKLTDFRVGDLVEEGRLLLRQKDRRIENKLKDRKSIMDVDFENHNASMINSTTKEDRSVLLHELMKQEGKDLAVGFEIKNDKVVFNLRSIGDFNVASLAEKYGGGGHKNAAGFVLDFEQGLKFIEKIGGKKCQTKQ